MCHNSNQLISSNGIFYAEFFVQENNFRIILSSLQEDTTLILTLN